MPVRKEKGPAAFCFQSIPPVTQRLIWLREGWAVVSNDRPDMAVDENASALLNGDRHTV